MGFIWSYIHVATGLFFLVAFEQGSCMPTSNQVSDYAKRRMTADEAVDVQKLLKDASQELTNEQVLRVLRRSILLYFKVCLFPYPPPTVDELPGPEGVLEDDHTPAAKEKGLRELLLESVQLTDPEKTLEFLKSSIKFRLLYCSLPTFNASFPMHTTQETASEITEGISPGNSTVNLDQTGTGQAVSNSLEVDTQGSIKREASDEINNEKTLSIVAEPEAKSAPSPNKVSLTQAVENDPAEERESKKNLNSAKPDLESRLETQSPINSQKNQLDFLRQNKATRVGTIIQNSAGIGIRKVSMSKKLNGSPSTDPRSSSEIIVSNKKPSNPLVGGSDMVFPANQEHKNEHPSLETSEKARKAGNSNEGEFRSVMRINYDEVAFRQQKPEMVGDDMGILS
ncbi:uncharacterized protein [Montipora capricornis]|uniref:uncharacterized protein n=1 Tax=Montipora capricornis TaxID=246305 RepID=UPI0035F17503